MSLLLFFRNKIPWVAPPATVPVGRVTAFRMAPLVTWVRAVPYNSPTALSIDTIEDGMLLGLASTMTAGATAMGLVSTLAFHRPLSTTELQFPITEVRFV